MADNLPADNVHKASFSGRVVAGAAYAGLTQVIFRLLGLVSLTVTARLLSPDDFGVVATSAVVVALMDRLTSSGVYDYIVSRRALDRPLLRTAWTVQFLRQCLAAVLVFLSAEPLATAFDEPRLEAVLKVIALMPLLEGLASPAFALLHREMRFRRMMVLRLAQRIISVGVAVAFAFLWRDYWALVAANVAASAALAVLSYVAVPFMPLIRFTGIVAVLTFSLQSIARQLSRFASTSAPRWLVRGGETSATFGGVSAALDLTALLVGEVISALSQPAMPSVRELKDDPARLASGLTIGLGLVISLAVAAAVGVALVAEPLVALLMGSQWAHIPPYVVLVAPGIAALGVMDICGGILVALGAQRRLTVFWLALAPVFFTALGLAYVHGGLHAVLAGFSGLMVASSLMLLQVLQRRLETPAGLMGIMVRALVAAGCMAMVLWLASPVAGSTWLQLLVLVPLGGAVWALIMLLCWWLAGRPPGAEAFAVGTVQRALQRRSL